MTNIFSPAYESDLPSSTDSLLGRFAGAMQVLSLMSFAIRGRGCAHRDLGGRRQASFHTYEMHAARQHKLEATVAFLLAIMVILLCYRGFDPRATDFRMFYSAAQMVRSGASHSLYDVSEQHVFQIRFANKNGLIFDYPAATILLYVPVSPFAIRTAYLSWVSASVILLLISSIFLNRALQLFTRPTILFATVLLFVPVWLNLMHGQVVAVVILAYCLGLLLMVQGREFSGGCALALGLIKFHLILPVLLLLLIRKRWRVIAGFSLCAVFFVGLCIATAGWKFLLVYPRMLLELPSLAGTGMHISAMANLHGLAVGLLNHEPPLAVFVAIYAVLLFWGARLWNRSDDELGIATAIVITVLISHHLNPHDLSLLIIPLAVVYKHAALLSWRALPLALFAPVLPLYLLVNHYWVLSCAVIVLLVVLAIPEKVHAKCEPLATTPAPFSNEQS